MSTADPRAVNVVRLPSGSELYRLTVNDTYKQDYNSIYDATKAAHDCANMTSEEFYSMLWGRAMDTMTGSERAETASLVPIIRFVNKKQVSGCITTETEKEDSN